MRWLGFLKRIPHKVQVTSKVFYEILYTPEIVGKEDCLGVTYLQQKQIMLMSKQSPKNMVHTYIHEVVHAFSEEYSVDLTERQVRAVEKS